MAKQFNSPDLITLVQRHEAHLRKCREHTDQIRRACVKSGLLIEGSRRRLKEPPPRGAPGRFGGG